MDTGHLTNVIIVFVRMRMFTRQNRFSNIEQKNIRYITEYL